MNKPSASKNEQAERFATIHCDAGLHMRPAMQFVDRAGQFASDVTVSKGDLTVDGKSIMHLTMLAATKGTQLKVVARGPDALQAVEVLAQLLERHTTE